MRIASPPTPLSSLKEARSGSRRVDLSSVESWSVTRSSISNTSSNSVSGLLMLRSNNFGLVWSPMRSRSLNPFVTTKAHFVEFLSSKAFVATVVPILIDEMLLVSIFWPRGIDAPVACSRIWRIPSEGLDGAVNLPYVTGNGTIRTHPNNW
jgi:hypothetical protein